MGGYRTPLELLMTTAPGPGFRRTCSSGDIYIASRRLPLYAHAGPGKLLEPPDPGEQQGDRDGAATAGAFAVPCCWGSRRKTYRSLAHDI